jgi:carboxypeptidase D
MLDRDVATGHVSIGEYPLYNSTGPGSSFDIKDDLPSSLKHEYYVRDAINTCTEEERLTLSHGTAVVKDCILVS